MPRTSITRLPLTFMSAFMLRGEGVVLVDCGYPLFLPQLRHRLNQCGVRPDEVKLILLTHGHLDHAGGAKAIRELTGAPVAMHRLDVPMLRDGAWPRVRPRTWLGWLTFIFTNLMPMPPAFRFEPDIVIDDSGFDLRPYGVDADVIHTPGHTQGSLSVLVEGGDALIGDLVLPNFPLFSTPWTPLYADSVAQVRESVLKVLAHKPNWLHCCHRGPLCPERTRRYFKLTGLDREV